MAGGQKQDNAIVSDNENRPHSKFEWRPRVETLWAPEETNDVDDADDPTVPAGDEAQ